MYPELKYLKHQIFGKIICRHKISGHLMQYAQNVRNTYLTLKDKSEQTKSGHQSCPVL